MVTGFSKRVGYSNLKKFRSGFKKFAIRAKPQSENVTLATSDVHQRCKWTWI